MMNERIKTCPVPKSQQPLYEYTSLKGSIEFSWTQNSTFTFLKAILLMCCILFTIWGCILWNRNIAENFTIKQFLLIANINNISVLIILVRYYLSWSYIYTRLAQATITYEESGWYDAQTWVKPTQMLVQDRLIGSYEVLPVIQRLKQSITFFILLIILGLLVFEFIIK
jgi:hypothetical protein